MELIQLRNSLLRRMSILNNRNITSEITFKTSRSSGPGGQHVNKVNTKVEASFNIEASIILTDEEKKTLLIILGGRLDKEKTLRVIDQGSRSQLKNKRQAIRKLIDLLEKALVKPKKRIPTKISAAKRQETLVKKRRRSLVKKMRGAIKARDFS